MFNRNRDQRYFKVCKSEYGVPIISVAEWKVFTGRKIILRNQSAALNLTLCTERECEEKCFSKGSCSGFSFDRKNAGCLLSHCGRIWLERSENAITYIKGIDFIIF